VFGGGGARSAPPPPNTPWKKGPLPQGGPRTALGEGAAGVGVLAAARDKPAPRLEYTPAR